MPKSSIQSATVALVVPFEPAVDGFENMRRDAALLNDSKVAARIYTWDGVWVSLGMSQNRGRDLVAGSQVPTVLRPTGGRAVLHGHDITLGLSCPLALLAGPHDEVAMLARSVRTVYRRVIAPICQALVEIGVPASLAEGTRFSKQPGRSADCFATASPNDIVRTDTGAKVCGVALRLTEGAVLVQASIPAGPPLVDPGLVFAEPAPVSWSEIPVYAFRDALTSNLRNQLVHAVR